MSYLWSKGDSQGKGKILSHSHKTSDALLNGMLGGKVPTTA